MSDKDDRTRATSHRGPEGRRTSSWLRFRVATFFALNFVSLAFIYPTVAAPLFGYTGLIARDLAWTEWLLLGMMAISPAFTLDLTVARPSSIATWFMYFSLVVPCCIVPEMIMDDMMQALYVSTAVVFNFHLLEILRLRAPLRVPHCPGYKHSLSIILPLFVLVSSVVLMATHGFHVDLNFGQGMYDRRLDARNEYAEGTLLGYGFALFNGVAVPFTIAEALNGYKILPMLAGFASVVAIVSINASRSTLFLAPFIVLIFFVFKRKRHRWVYMGGASSLPRCYAGSWAAD